MRVLLVNNGGTGSSRFSMNEARFPIGLGYLSSVLKQHGHETRLIDRFADRDAWVEDVQQFDFVAVYASTPCYDDALRILRLLEDYQGPIAFGGPHSTAFPNTIPPRVDYVVQGEAEYLIKDLVEGRFPRGSLIRTQRIRDLDALPRADYDLFLDRPRSYLWTTPFSSDLQPIFLVNTSRSCPYQCAFCSVRDVWGRLWTAQSPDRVVDDIEYLKRTYELAGVYFREDIFTADKKRVYRIAELLIRRDLDIIWACETRVDAGSDPELIEIMARSGCRGIYIGAESGSQRMLDRYNKEIQVDQIAETCRHARKNGIAVGMSLIVDHPEETWRDRRATRALLRKAKPEMVWENPYRDEFTRHGEVDHPTYAAREVIDFSFEGGTWGGQTDRLAARAPRASAPTGKGGSRATRGS
jgi:radical SAM superfamily enzyme YgiQ (UPF0313 family)